MRTFFLPITLLAVATLAHADCAADVIALRQALAFEPVALANLNASKGDLRFFDVGRLKRTAPGVDDQKCVRAGHLSMSLPGTSDTPCSKEHQELNRRALAYARQYNDVIARLRTERALPVCASR